MEVGVLDSLCVAHIKANARLAKAKLDEMSLRKQVCKMLVDIDGGAKKETYETSKFQIVANAKSTISLEKDDDGDLLLTDEVYEELDDESLSCVSLKKEYVLDKKKFTKLLKDDEDLEIADFITEKPATPTLKITLIEE